MSFSNLARFNLRIQSSLKSLNQIPAVIGICTSYQMLLVQKRCKCSTHNKCLLFLISIQASIPKGGPSLPARQCSSEQSHPSCPDPIVGTDSAMAPGEPSVGFCTRAWEAGEGQRRRETFCVSGGGGALVQEKKKQPDIFKIR